MYVLIAASQACFTRLAFSSESHILFMGPANTFFLKKFYRKKTLKLSPTVLFTYLKIILLQYFQFSGISDIQINR